MIFLIINQKKTAPTQNVLMQYFKKRKDLQKVSEIIFNS